MAKVKIRHGLAFYLDETVKDRPVQRTAFRTQVIDVSSNEAARLKSIGAAVAEDEELPRQGVLTPIPNTASDEELIAWVSVATKDEIAQAVAERPLLKDRLLSAADIIKKRLEAQQDLLNGLKPAISKGERLAAKRKEGQSAPTTGLTGRNQVTQSQDEEDLDDLEDEDEDEEEELDEDDPREVVKGNVDHVSKHLSEHPDQAGAVMEAENDLAEAQKRAPREGVIKAVQAAATSNSQ